MTATGLLDAPAVPATLPPGWSLAPGHCRAAMGPGYCQVALAFVRPAPCPAVEGLVEALGHWPVREAVRRAVAGGKALARYRALLPEARAARDAVAAVEAEGVRLERSRQEMLDDADGAEGLTAAVADVQRQLASIDLRLAQAQEVARTVQGKLTDATRRVTFELGAAHRQANAERGAWALARMRELLEAPVPGDLAGLLDEVMAAAEVGRLSAFNLLGGSTADLLAKLTAEAEAVGAGG
jgi:hypothetical protein